MTKVLISIIEFFHKPFRKLISLQTFTYAAIGGGNTLLDVVLYFIIYNFVLHQQLIDLGFVAISGHISAVFIVFPITFLSGFLLHKYVTFNSSQNTGKIQLFRYSLVVAGALILKYICIKFFVEGLHIWPTFANALTVPILIGFSYFSNSRYTFKKSQTKHQKPHITQL